MNAFCAFLALVPVMGNLDSLYHIGLSFGSSDLVHLLALVMILVNIVGLTSTHHASGGPAAGVEEREEARTPRAPAAFIVPRTRLRASPAALPFLSRCQRG